MWDFVGREFFSGHRPGSQRGNSLAFMCLPYCEYPETRWHTVCSLLRPTLFTRLASRGGWNPTSTGIPVIGGSVLGKRGLAPAPFFILGLCASRWLIRGSRGWSCFSPVGRKTLRPSVLPASKLKPS